MSVNVKGCVIDVGIDGLFVVSFGGDEVATNGDESGGHEYEDNETEGVVEFSVIDGFGFPELAGGVVSLSVFFVVGRVGRGHDLR